jgi:hypothetical protein
MLYKDHSHKGRKRPPSCEWRHRASKEEDTEIGRSIARNNAWADQSPSCEACGGKTVVLSGTTVCERCYQIS